MSDEITRPDGTVLKPINMGERFGVSDEQLNSLRDAISQKSFNGFNDAISRQAEQWQSVLAEYDEALEAGREETIRRQAEANAEAYVKALRTSPYLFDKIVGALASLCGNPTYNYSTLEDPMNDYVRDILGHGLQIRDQTRQGISENSRSAERGKAGELDIQIRNNGRPIGIYEGLRLKNVNSTEIYRHIEKATINYNPQGVKEVFVVAYVREQENQFGSFWGKFVECVKAYQAPDPEYEIIWDEEEEDTGLSAVRSIHGIYNMDGVEHNVHAMAVKLMK